MNYSTLIGADELRRHGRDWAVFDCRAAAADPAVGALAYRNGHIPGARHADLDRVLAGPRTPRSGRHPLPEREKLAAWLARQGVAPATQIVAYDDAGGAFAARLWWLVRWLGHARVAVLDGGLAAWCAAGGELERETPAVPSSGGFEILSPLAAAVDAEEVLAVVRGRARGVLVDARAVERYRGEVETIDSVAGHIPGARNRPFTLNLRTDGRFRTADELHSEFSGLVGSDPAAAIHYCGSGVTAAHNVLAMEHAGLRGSRLFAGSWSEWIEDPSRPVAGPGDRPERR